MLKSGLKWMFLIIGTTIGAGYASGREIWEFFGHGSGLAIVLFILFFTISCTVIMYISHQFQTEEYRPVLRTIVGGRLTAVYDGMIFLYLYTTTVVMLSGSGASVQSFQLSYGWGIIIMCIALILLFIRDINGLLEINQIILPVLIIGLIAVLLQFIRDEQLELFSHWHEQDNWHAAFPFTALNILPLIAVLGAIGSKIKSKQEIWIACIGSGLVLGIITYIYNNSLIQIADELLVYEIPLFAILNSYSLNMLIFMSFLLWFAIYTTAAAGLLGIVTRLKGYFKNVPLWLMTSCLLITMLPLTAIGFSTLIGFLYPLYGILNLYVLIRLLLYPLWNTTK
ncbi:hypothetical protein DX933_01645 [Ornithinibacillus gellani]|uniref:YkvI family membrane protein n=1 Tax=Ornithinibacillus gellani TaxID=2293253 RepID=UPI000F49CACD|nr:hypothetical protein [Ornithinibacillus gellani]TQS76338.1 hypothetical protein DX933_01645 [Ornithinibacillus gellani]